jgi:hypothetical protein
MITDIQSRVEQVNQVIQIIGNHGLRAFFNERLGIYALIQEDPQGKLWLIDESTQAKIYIHPSPWEIDWMSFSHGETLRGLIMEFCEYIRTGVPISFSILHGLERQPFEEGNESGYDYESIQAVRKQAGAIPVFKQKISISQKLRRSSR